MFGVLPIRYRCWVNEIALRYGENVPNLTCLLAFYIYRGSTVCNIAPEWLPDSHTPTRDKKSESPLHHAHACFQISKVNLYEPTTITEWSLPSIVCKSLVHQTASTSAQLCTMDHGIFSSETMCIWDFVNHGLSLDGLWRMDAPIGTCKGTRGEGSWIKEMWLTLWWYGIGKVPHTFLHTCAGVWVYGKWMSAESCRCGGGGRLVAP